VGAAFFIAALASTPVDARQKYKPPQFTYDQHGVGSASYGPQYQQRAYPWPSKIKKQPAKRQSTSLPVQSQSTNLPAKSKTSLNRDCLTPDTRELLSRLEATFGRVNLISTCRAGARMPTGDVSWHARNRAFDFVVPKGIDKRDVMVWLGKNSPGVTISYRSMAHIHTDTGNFRKVIYNAANHEAGHRAVAIWKARAMLASAPPQPGPQPRFTASPMLFAKANPDDPLHEYPVPPPADRAPEPIGQNARRDILRRYMDSKDVVVQPHTTLTCPNGAPFPDDLVQLLRDASSHFGRTAYVNSGYRTPERNRRVGGARNSQHMKCRAIDFRVAGVSVGDLRRYVVSNLNKWRLRGLGTYSSHLHVDIGQRKTTRLVTWTGRYKRQAKRRQHRYASAG
jgi:uncharacterized protein YcbK (DUF882 family)